MSRLGCNIETVSENEKVEFMLYNGASRKQIIETFGSEILKTGGYNVETFGNL